MNKKLNGFRMPAEWELQKSVWIAWPYNKNDWPGLFQGIPEVFTKIISSISKDQKVNLLVNSDKNEIIKFLKLANSNLKNIRFYKIYMVMFTNLIILLAVIFMLFYNNCCNFSENIELVENNQTTTSENTTSENTTSENIKFKNNNIIPVN